MAPNPCCCCEVETGVKLLTFICMIIDIVLVSGEAYTVSTKREPLSLDFENSKDRLLPPIVVSVTIVILVKDIVHFVMALVVFLGAANCKPCLLRFWYMSIPLAVINVALAFFRIEKTSSRCILVAVAVLLEAYFLWVIQSLISKCKRQSEDRAQATPFQPVAYPQSPDTYGQQSQSNAYDQQPPPYTFGQQEQVQSTKSGQQLRRQ